MKIFSHRKEHSLRRLVTVGLSGLILGAPPQRCATALESPGLPSPRGTPFFFALDNNNPREPLAGHWKTWLLTSGSELRLSAPPAPGSAELATEITELKTIQSQRTQQMIDQSNFWATGPASQRWTEEEISLITLRKPDGLLSSRAMALVHIAIYDAVVAAYDSKYTYNRPHPAQVDSSITTTVPQGEDPCYPSEHAVVAGAASHVLAYLFPNDAADLATLERQAADSRVNAGVNFRSDVERGLDLGHQVADRVIAFAKADNSDLNFSGPFPNGPCNWVPTPPSFDQPLRPLWSKVKTWLITRPDQFRPGPPPSCDTPEFDQQAQQVKSSVENLTSAQKSTVAFWADGLRSRYFWDQQAMTLLERDGFNTPRAARLMALLTATEHDERVAVWDCKYTYWEIRPITVIQKSSPTWTSYLETPNHPTYACAHCAWSKSAAEILSFFFPNDAASLRAQADECSNSRVLGGFHYPFDVDAGKQIGLSVSALAIDHAKNDGSDQTPVAQNPTNADIVIGPIPWKPGSGGPFDSATVAGCGQGVIFQNLPSGSRVRIYSVAGDLLREFDQNGSTNCQAWDGRNKSGKDAATGVYLAVIDGGSGDRMIRKLAVER
jgi:hypothetical protein